MEEAVVLVAVVAVVATKTHFSEEVRLTHKINQTPKIILRTKKMKTNFKLLDTPSKHPLVRSKTFTIKTKTLFKALTSRT